MMMWVRSLHFNSMPETHLLDVLMAIADALMTIAQQYSCHLSVLTSYH
ncbi:MULTISPECIES: hypothetical protein [Nostoc]|uniref:Transposase n=1 Tax=Nostoc paludosum FACHB-159 TaxID=2692908 RepID=A0ABR8KF24_9NOSO|nr:MULTISPECIES: hypothetical protein [Nostoc]MBD2681752.1 hypothetical protein [Nostoc sp. FACHB-857]MBD2738167.1 hypothetical protein [Nostoc paludosum FACHB-159]